MLVLDLKEKNDSLTIFYIVQVWLVIGWGGMDSEELSSVGVGWGPNFCCCEVSSVRSKEILNIKRESRGRKFQEIERWGWHSTFINSASSFLSGKKKRMTSELVPELTGFLSTASWLYFENLLFKHLENCLILFDTDSTNLMFLSFSELTAMWSHL